MKRVFIFPLIFFPLGFIVGVSYWFVWRPAQIRASCAWVHVKYDAVPAVEADDSIVLPPKPHYPIILGTPEETDPGSSDAKKIYFKELDAWNDLYNKKYGNPGREVADYWEKADDFLYQRCLDDAGLER